MRIEDLLAEQSLTKQQHERAQISYRTDLEKLRRELDEAERTRLQNSQSYTSHVQRLRNEREQLRQQL